MHSEVVINHPEGGEWTSSEIAGSLPPGSVIYVYLLGDPLSDGKEEIQEIMAEVMLEINDDHIKIGTQPGATEIEDGMLVVRKKDHALLHSVLPDVGGPTVIPVVTVPLTPLDDVLVELGYTREELAGEEE